MVSVVADDAWQDAFGACVEHDVVTAVSVLSIETRSASSSSGKLPVVPSSGAVAGIETWPIRPVCDAATNSEVMAMSAKFPTLFATNKTFSTWISSMPIVVRRVLTSSYVVFECVRQTWFLKASLCQPAVAKVGFRLRPLHKTKTRELHHAQSPVRDRLRAGKAYLAWLAAFCSMGTLGHSAKPLHPRVAFLRTTYPHLYIDSKPVPKKDKSWLIRCVKLAATMDDGGDALAVVPHGGALGANRKLYQRTRDAGLKCTRGTRGRKHQCPALREALWDWFVDVRASIRTSISPKFLLQQAKRLVSMSVVLLREASLFRFRS